MSEADCTRCRTPLELGDLRCSVCALPAPIAIATTTKARSHVLRCTECGAAVGFDANKQAPACAFCSAVMTVEHPYDPVEVATHRLPFAVDRDTATTSLRAWLGGRGWFAPKALRDEAVFETLRPLCWAAWIVNARAEVAWTADSDYGSNRSDWAPHAGTTEIDFANIVVSASRGLRGRECAQLVHHYDVRKLVPVGGPRGSSAYDDTDLHAAMEGFDAQRSAARARVQDAIDAEARDRIAPSIPGRRHRKVNVSCLLEGQTTDRVALPAWVLAYRYRGSPYRAIVHGQKPSIVIGTSPIDWVKVMWLVAGVAAIAVLVALLVAAR